MTMFDNQSKPIIGCVHLKALPGSPLYDGNLEALYQHALRETEIFETHGVDGLIIENFGDRPFYPGYVPNITTASMAAIAREIRLNTKLPIGINVLRNDANSALSIAHAIQAQFIRVNIHLHACVTDQGIIQGSAHETLRLKAQLASNVQIFADVDVKHATPLGQRTLAEEVSDLCERGLIDALIVSGKATSKPTDIHDLEMVKKSSSVPVLIGSGITLDNFSKFVNKADGFIVGSCFKENGIATNPVEATRVGEFMQQAKKLRQSIK